MLYLLPIVLFIHSFISYPSLSLERKLHEIKGSCFLYSHLLTWASVSSTHKLRGGGRREKGESWQVLLSHTPRPTQAFQAGHSLRHLPGLQRGHAQGGRGLQCCGGRVQAFVSGRRVTSRAGPAPPRLVAGGKKAWPGARAPRPPAPPPE